MEWRLDLWWSLCIMMGIFGNSQLGLRFWIVHAIKKIWCYGVGVDFSRTQEINTSGRGNYMKTKVEEHVHRKRLSIEGISCTYVSFSWMYSG